jgi:hypothetical protein
MCRASEQVLRVPLNSEHGERGVLDRLHHAIVSPAHHSQLRGHELDSLMMDAVHVDPRCAYDPCQLAPLLHLDVMDCCRSGFGHEMLQLGDLRQVLNKCSSQSDVQHLATSTDGQDRKPGAHRSTDEADLKGIPFLVDASALWRRNAAVPTRIYIAATGEQQPVDSFEDLVRGKSGQGGNKEGNASRRDHCLGIRRLCGVGAAAIELKMPHRDADSWTPSLRPMRPTPALPASRICTCGSVSDNLHRARSTLAGRLVTHRPRGRHGEQSSTQFEPDRGGPVRWSSRLGGFSRSIHSGDFVNPNIAYPKSNPKMVFPTVATEQIAVRLPEDLLTELDALVATGVHESRAAAVRAGRISS